MLGLFPDSGRFSSLPYLMLWGDNLLTLITDSVTPLQPPPMTAQRE